MDCSCVIFFYFLRREGGGEMWGMILCVQMVQVMWCEPASPSQSWGALLQPPTTTTNINIPVQCRWGYWDKQDEFCLSGLLPPCLILNSLTQAIAWPAAPVGEEGAITRWRLSQILANLELFCMWNYILFIHTNYDKFSVSIIFTFIFLLNIANNTFSME